MSAGYWDSKFTCKQNCECGTAFDSEAPKLIEKSILNKFLPIELLGKNTHVIDVIFVIFCPMVSLTLLPSIHIPRHIPTAPYKSSEIEASDFCRTEPSVKINQIPINGPIALLHKENKI